MLSGVCFCNLTLILSAGRDKKAVITDAITADILGSIWDFYLNTGLIISVTISFPASWPILINKTLNIVISSPLHNFNIPSSLTILENAWKVLLYAFFPVDIDACRRINATSNGFPIIAPNIPLNADKPIFYTRPIFILLFLNFYTAHV